MNNITVLITVAIKTKKLSIKESKENMIMWCLLQNLHHIHKKESSKTRKLKNDMISFVKIKYLLVLVILREIKLTFSVTKEIQLKKIQRLNSFNKIRMKYLIYYYTEVKYLQKFKRKFKDNFIFTAKFCESLDTSWAH